MKMALTAVLVSDVITSKQQQQMAAAIKGSYLSNHRRWWGFTVYECRTTWMAHRNGDMKLG